MESFYGIHKMHNKTLFMRCMDVWQMSTTNKHEWKCNTNQTKQKNQTNPQDCQDSLTRQK